MAAGLLALAATSASAATNTWDIDAGGSWAFTTNWNPNTNFPNAVGDVANLTLDITGNRTISLDAPITVGTLKIGDPDATHTYMLQDGDGGSLMFDVLAGHASLTQTNASKGDTISTTITVNDDLDITNGNTNGTLTIDGDISGTGGLVKLGAGTLTLSGTNTHGGATTVRAGTLVVVTGGSCSNSAVSIAASEGNTANLRIAVADPAKQWTCSALVVTNSGAGCGLDFEFGTVTPSTGIAPLNVTGDVLFLTAPDITVNAANSTGGATTQYPLLTWGSGGWPPPPATFTLTPSRITGHLAISGNTLVLVIDGNPEPLTWAAGATGTWNTITANWKDNAGTTVVYREDSIPGDQVVFDETYVTDDAEVVLTNTVHPASVTVSNAAYKYTIGGSGVIAGATSLTKAGTGTLILSGTNIYSGSTVISGGTLRLNSPAVGEPPTSGLIGYWNFDEGTGTNAYDTSGALTPHDGEMGISAAWTNSGKINGAVSVDGSIAAATAVDTDLGLPGSQARTISAWVRPSSTPPPPNDPNNGATGFWSLFGCAGRSFKRFGAGEFFDFEYDNITGSGLLVLGNRAGWHTMGGNEYVTVGPWTNYLHSWHLLTATFDASARNTGTAKAYVDGVPVTNTTMTLCGGNDFGVEDYHSGVTELVDDLRLYDRALSAAEVTRLFNWNGEPVKTLKNCLPTTTALKISVGGTLDLNGVCQQVGSLEGHGAITNSSTNEPCVFTAGDAGSTIFDGTISDTGPSFGLSLTKTGSGKLTLTGANTYAGNTTIHAGVLQIGDGANATARAGSGALAVGSGSLLFDLNGPATLDNYVVSVRTGGSITNIGTGKVTFYNDTGLGNPCTIDGGTGGIELLSTITQRGVGVFIKGEVWMPFNAYYSNITAAGPAALHLTSASGDMECWWIGSRDPAYPLDFEIEAGVVVNMAAIASPDGPMYYNDLWGAGSLSYNNNGPKTDMTKGAYILGDSTLGGVLTAVTPVSFGSGGTGGTAGATRIVNSSGVIFDSTTDNEYAGIMSGTGWLLKSATNTLILSGTNSYGGGTTVAAGKLLVNNVNGSGTGGGLVTVQDGATLGGTGTIGGSAVVQSGGTIAAGGADGLGSLTIQSNLTFSAGSINSVRIAGFAPGQYGSITVTDGPTIDLGGAVLAVDARGAYHNGIVWLIDNQTIYDISGTFQGWTEGSANRVGGLSAKIYYGADKATGLTSGGNDVALKLLPDTVLIIR